MMRRRHGVAARAMACGMAFAMACAMINAFSMARCEAAAHLDPTPIAGRHPFTATDGAALYASICAGCHMPDGRGAQGAGSYPSLAHNAKLRSPTRPAFMVVNGLRSMPAFRDDLDDAQIAAVVNYVITHFGNHAKAPATAAEIKALREAR